MKFEEFGFTGTKVSVQEKTKSLENYREPGEFSPVSPGNEDIVYKLEPQGMNL